MRTFVGALANRLYAMQAQVAHWLPKRAVDVYGRMQARLDSIAAPTVGSATADWILASCLIVAGPLLLASLLLAVLCGGTLWDCVPAWYDETWYFNEMSVYDFAGWNGGYTVCQEWPARAEWVHFGTHGPFVPVLYAGFAQLTGMHLATIPIANAVLLLAGGLCWVACCRVNVQQSWVAALVMATFWPLILYIPTSMQEVMHASIAFTLAALTVLLIRNRENKRLLLLLLAAIAVAAQTRITWALVAVPVFWVAMRPQSKWQMAVFAASSTAFVAPLYLVGVMLVSPYPNFMKTVLEGAADSPFMTVLLIFKHSLKGIERYFAPNHDTIVEIVFRYQTMLIVGVAIYQLRNYWLNRSLQNGAKKSSDKQADLSVPAYGFTLLNLLCIIGFVIAFYDVHDWRDYRVIAPHFLLSLLVLVGCGAMQWLKCYVIMGVMVSVFVSLQFAEFHRPRVAFDSSQVASFSETVGTVVKFDPAASSAWENTLLVDMNTMDEQELLTLPRGIGITTVVVWKQQAWPPRSKYVLLERERAESLGIPASMQKVAETQIGDLYMRQ